MLAGTVEVALWGRQLSEHVTKRTGQPEGANAQLLDERAERQRAAAALHESRMHLAAALPSGRRRARDIG